MKVKNKSKISINLEVATPGHASKDVEKLATWFERNVQGNPENSREIGIMKIGMRETDD